MYPICTLLMILHHAYYFVFELRFHYFPIYAFHRNGITIVYRVITHHAGDLPITKALSV